MYPELPYFPTLGGRLARFGYQPLILVLRWTTPNAPFYPQLSINVGLYCPLTKGLKMLTPVGMNGQRKAPDGIEICPTTFAEHWWN